MPPQKGVDSVELQRLQALVETQRKHIEELKAQLHEVLVSTSGVVSTVRYTCCTTLPLYYKGSGVRSMLMMVVTFSLQQEVKTQQQLQLVEQSPARRSVKQLLARAAADNTALAKKVEELRAQRNALAVTKAALTAQVAV